VRGCEEYERFRWKPVRADVPSLCAPDGGLWHTSEQTAEHASLDDVRRELRAQIDLALESGIDVTHLDAHMGTAVRPEFANVYIDLASEYRLPAFIPRITLAQLTMLGMAAAWDVYRVILEHAERAGLPLFDHFDLNSLGFEPGTGLEHNRRRVEQLQPGLTYLITHCAHGGTELQSIAGEWRQRAEECRIYSDGSMAQVLARAGVRAIGMRPLRDAMRAEAKH
jgi:chitin disaccharide deacetylase